MFGIVQYTQPFESLTLNRSRSLVLSLHVQTMSTKGKKRKANEEDICGDGPAAKKATTVVVNVRGDGQVAIGSISGMDSKSRKSRITIGGMIVSEEVKTIVIGGKVNAAAASTVAGASTSAVSAPTTVSASAVTPIGAGVGSALSIVTSDGSTLRISAGAGSIAIGHIVMGGIVNCAGANTSDKRIPHRVQFSKFMRRASAYR